MVHKVLRFGTDKPIGFAKRPLLLGWRCIGGVVSDLERGSGGDVHAKCNSAYIILFIIN
jgi:hypothetical protein